MSTTQGKALLVITRTNEDSARQPYFEVTPFIQKCEGDEAAKDWAYECFSLLDYGGLPAPDAAYRLRYGDTVRVYVVFRIDYWKGAWGYDDDDVTLTYLKERVLRKQKFKPRYFSKADR